METLQATRTSTQRRWHYRSRGLYESSDSTFAIFDRLPLTSLWEGASFFPLGRPKWRKSSLTLFLGPSWGSYIASSSPRLLLAHSSL